VTVEELFQLPSVRRSEEVVEASGLGGALPGTVRLATVSGRRWAFGLDLGDASGTISADGVGTRESVGRVRVRHVEERPPEPDLVVAGCDPAFGLVREYLQRERGLEVLWIRTGSRSALEALARGAVHVAGVHLRDTETGDYNRPWVERVVPFPSTTVGFATWEQAILVAPGNPLEIQGVGDLTRPGMRFLNREPGSGSRLLTETALAEHGLSGEDVPGFLDTAADRHETVARAVASGLAQAGVAIRAVGRPLDLGVIPLAEEPYELVVASHFLELPAVGALLDTLRRPALRHQVEALTGYDAAAMGRSL
jgi:molybdate-binding protein